MAPGIPVVSTDCLSGPRELLDAGRIAPLVEMGDVDGWPALLRYWQSLPDQRCSRGRSAPIIGT